jgi:hypothetical protein
LEKFENIENMKVDNLKHSFIIESIVAIFGKQFEIFLKKQQGILQQNILFFFFRKMAKICHKTKSLNKSPPPFFSPQKKSLATPPFFCREVARNVAPKKKTLVTFGGPRIESGSLHCTLSVQRWSIDRALALSKHSLAGLPGVACD